MVDGRQIESEPPNPDSLEGRASIALKALAFINVAGAVIALFPPLLPISVLHTLTFNLAACGLAVLEIIEARALDRGRPWAVAIVRPILLLLIASGIGSVLVGLGEGRIRVPFEAAFGLWAILGAADMTLVRRADRRSRWLVAVAVPLIGTMLFGRPVFGWGGLLDVRAPDIHGSIDADCRNAGADLPESVTVTYSWRWTRTSPLPNGLDIIVIGWSGTDANGRPLYYFDHDPESGRGIHSGDRGYPSIDLATQVAKDSAASWAWGVELGEQGLQPGRIELQLRRGIDAPPKPSPLVFTASYVHLGIWRSEPVTVTCSW